jgi:Asp/Glu/hydantoin racemase
VTLYRTRRGARNYGFAVGILQLDCSLPFIPGDVDNASTYDYPVIYRAIPGLSTASCLRGAPEMTEAVVQAARDFEVQGVRVISSDCGFMLQFQAAVREAVRIPVALSPLLQLPVIASSQARGRPIGIITADSANLTSDFLQRAGLATPDHPLVIRGLQDQPEFRSAVFDEKGTLDAAQVETEVVSVALDMLREDPAMGAILLECSMLPPYANAVQQATGLPVFDFVTMINQFHQSTHQRRYQGSY